MFAIRIRSNVASWLWTQGGNVQYFDTYEAAAAKAQELFSRNLGGHHGYKVERVGGGWAPGDLATISSGLGGKVDVRLLAKTPEGNWQVRVDMPRNPDFHGWMVETGEDNLQPYSGPSTRRGRLSDRLEAGIHPINPNVGQ
jgi:hypothetical protein